MYVCTLVEGGLNRCDWNKSDYVSVLRPALSFPRSLLKLASLRASLFSSCGDAANLPHVAHDCDAPRRCSSVRPCQEQADVLEPYAF